MARPTRDFQSSEWHHVYNRGHDRQDIFSLRGDQELFESLIDHAAEQTGVEVHAFALMSNHFHLVVKAGGPHLADFMHLLCSRYAAAYNQRSKRSGSVFDGRYGLVPITDEPHLLAAARYVERNPLAFVPEAALAAYVHSSFGCYLGVRAAPAWLHTDFLTELLNGRAYQRFVLDDHESDHRPHGDLPALRPVAPDIVFACVADVTGADPITTGGTARNLATAITLELRSATVPDLAVLLEMSTAGVRQAARRGRISIDTDPAAQRTRCRAIERLRTAA